MGQILITIESIARHTLEMVGEKMIYDGIDQPTLGELLRLQTSRPRVQDRKMDFTDDVRLTYLVKDLFEDGPTHSHHINI